MPFNPLDPRHMLRLRSALSASINAMQPFRNHWMFAKRQYAGRHYGPAEDGSQENVPVNLIELFVNIYTQQLASNTPQALVVTEQEQLRPLAYDHQLSVNQLLNEIDLQSSLETWVVEALFSLGILKVGISEDAKALGLRRNRNQPYAEPVLLDDYIVDMRARDDGQKSFEGNRYRVPLEWARDNQAFDRRERQRLRRTSTRYEDTDDNGDRAEDLSLGSGMQHDDELEDMVELIDVFLPRQGLLMTISAQHAEAPLRVIEWEGPECGPYHTLGFNRVPGNLMPLSPMAALLDLHEMTNQAWRKLARQADRMKSVNYYKLGADEDASRVLETGDGGSVGVSDVDNLVKEYRYGGPDNALLGFAIKANQEFSRHGGNLDVLGGLASQAGTLGQEELLKASSSGRVNYMQNKMVRATAGVIRSLAFWDWHDPFRVRHLTRVLPGLSIRDPFEVTPEMRREHDFFEFNFRIEPHSLQFQGPGQRLNVLTSTLERLVWPVLPVLAQQGVAPNFFKLFDYVAQYANLPEFRDVLAITGPVQSAGPIQPPRMAAQTKRTYERVNRPGMTRDGADRTLTNVLMGGNPQSAERQSLDNPIAG